MKAPRATSSPHHSIAFVIREGGLLLHTLLPTTVVLSSDPFPGLTVPKAWGCCLSSGNSSLPAGNWWLGCFGVTGCPLGSLPGEMCLTPRGGRASASPLCFPAPGLGVEDVHRGPALAFYQPLSAPRLIPRAMLKLYRKCLKIPSILQKSQLL